MRISDDRYTRDRFRLDLALRFMRHEARTHTIRKWTGLTDDRIRKLYRAYLNETPGHVSRHRGKSPGQAFYFTRTPRVQQESACEPVLSARRSSDACGGGYGEPVARRRAGRAVVPGVRGLSDARAQFAGQL